MIKVSYFPLLCKLFIANNSLFFNLPVMRRYVVVIIFGLLVMRYFLLAMLKMAHIATKFFLGKRIIVTPIALIYQKLSFSSEYYNYYEPLDRMTKHIIFFSSKSHQIEIILKKNPLQIPQHLSQSICHGRVRQRARDWDYSL